MSLPKVDTHTLKRLFDAIDTDKSGFLSTSEFKTLVKALSENRGLSLTDAQINQIAEVSRHFDVLICMDFERQCEYDSSVHFLLSSSSGHGCRRRQE